LFTHQKIEGLIFLYYFEIFIYIKFFIAIKTFNTIKKHQHFFFFFPPENLFQDLKINN